MLYIYIGMKKRILKYQQQVLKALSGKIDDFYLAGGTALSIFYFQHRLSVDLDFFTKTFSLKRIEQIIANLRQELNKPIRQARRVLEEKLAKMIVYNVNFTKQDSLKIDFVEDAARLIKKPKTVDGINILSLEDIYIRKIYALAGVIRTVDEVGRPHFTGGRADAKDFYDLYYLSHTFMPMSRFVMKYCDDVTMEALVMWHRTYQRLSIADGILTLETDKTIDYKIMERHFNKEINALIEQGLSNL